MTSLGLGAGVLFRTNEKKKKNYRRPATQATDTITYFPSSKQSLLGPHFKAEDSPSWISSVSPFVPISLIHTFASVPAKYLSPV